MPFPFVIAAVVITAVGGAIYAATSSDSQSSPSDEDVKAERRRRIKQEFARDICDFWRNNDFMLCLSNRDARMYCSLLPSKVRSGEISPSEALYQLHEGEQSKKWLGARVDLTAPVKFMDCHYSSLQHFVDSLNEGLSAPYPKPLLSDHYELCRKEGLVLKLREAINRRLAGQPCDFPQMASSDSQLVTLWERLCVAVDAVAQTEPVIVVCGLLKAGKSSLLNSLFDDMSDTLFKVGVTRTTTANQHLSRFGANFIDTPGLEADEQDTRVAWDGYRKADLLLFVHSGERELTSQEIVFLKRLQAEGMDLSSRLCFIVSQQDVAGKHIEELKSRISHQLGACLGASFKIHCVSSKRYKIDKLRSHSGIDELRGELQAQIRELSRSVASLRAFTVARNVDEFKACIQKLERAASEERQRMDAERAEIWASFSSSVLERARREYKNV